MGKIIVVEDDAPLREQIVTFLALSGLDVCGVGSAAELYRRMAVEKFGILILDLRLPDEDGIAIAAHVRRLSDIGIIMVSARNAIDDRVRGREAGADVYLAKPVDLDELTAAVKALFRRLQAAPAPVAPPASGWVLDSAAFLLRAPNGRTARLTATDMDLFACLAAQRGAVASRGDLLKALGRDPTDPTDRNLDAAIRRLRAKIEQATGIPVPIRTVHAVGYQFIEGAGVDG